MTTLEIILLIVAMVAVAMNIASLSLVHKAHRREREWAEIIDTWRQCVNLLTDENERLKKDVQNLVQILEKK